jgi:hypothetical protein
VTSLEFDHFRGGGGEETKKRRKRRGKEGKEEKEEKEENRQPISFYISVQGVYKCFSKTPGDK